MNIKKQVLAFLAMASLGTIGLQARVSNIAYQLGSDAVNVVQTGGTGIGAGGQPMTDPTLGTNALDVNILGNTGGTPSMFNLSAFDSANNQMFLAESASTARVDKSLMAARKSGGVIKLTSLAPAAPTFTDYNPVGGGTLLTTLQNVAFDRIAGTSGKVALRNAADDEFFYIVDSGSSNVVQSRLADGAGAAVANVDNFVFANGNLVVGLFETGTTVYEGNTDGRIRSVNVSTGVPNGVAKMRNNADTAYIELVMDSTGGNDTLDQLTGAEAREVDNIGAMHWDSTLSRLFVSFSSDHTPIGEDDSVPFLVGRFADGTEGGTTAGDVLFEPFAPAGAATPGGSRVPSFANNEAFSIPFIKTMHIKGTKADGTAFDRPYLIAQMNHDTSAPTGTVNSRIFSIPLVSTHATVANIGKANDIADATFATPAAAVANLHPQDPTSANSDVRALVGGARLPVDSMANIKAMTCIGHTVLVGANFGATALQSQIGVWASTAIINEDGAITGWSPWTRVAGMHEQVCGLGSHPSTGDLWAVHGDRQNAAAVSVAGVSMSCFGTGLAAPLTVAGTLPARQEWDTCGLGEIGRQAKTDLAGRIFTSRQFHAIRTPGMSGRSLVAFGGEGRLVVARGGFSSVTGRAGAATVSEFHRGVAESNRDFKNDIDTSTNDFYQHFNSTNQPTLSGLGNIYSVGVAGSRTSNQGWLFAGGDSGAVVFSADGTGNGWESVATGVAGLDNLVTDIGNLTSKKIGNLPGPVIALEGVSTQQDGSTTAAVASTSFMLALTKTGLYRIPLSAATFDTVANAAAIVPEAVTLGLAGDERCLFLSMLSNHGNDTTLGTSCGVLVTTRAVYVLNDLANATVGNVSVSKKPFETTDFSGTVRRAEILPRAPYSTTTQLGGAGVVEVADSVIGNLIITTGTISNPESAVYTIPLIGQQKNGFTAGNSRQGGFILQTGATGVLNPIRLASPSELGSAKAFGTALGGSAPFISFSRQSVAGTLTDAHVDVVGQSQNASLGSLSISSFAPNSGGSGGLMMSSRDGSIISQE